MGLTVLGASAIALILLRSLLRKKQQLKGKVVVITGASSGIGEGNISRRPLLNMLDGISFVSRRK